ncbi:hypothetical protein [Altererythrobacter aquiaggeris]|uniref:hypothetical protein n=1 Tax=Aestuarierythrobacter aquiaggeris TaxID=1898396 RepID=UPI003017E3C5
MRAILLPLIALSMVSAPVSATQVVRSAAPVDGESELVGRPYIPIIVLIAAVAIGIIIASDDDDDDAPVSA